MDFSRQWLSLVFGVFFSQAIWALGPVPEFVKKEKFGEIQIYELVGKEIDLSMTSSEFTYDDLTQKNVSELEGAMETKKNFGSIFGFNNWRASSHKLIQEGEHRIFLLNGSYTDANKVKVYFVEVYWANRSKSGQALITTHKSELKLDDYKSYLK